MRLWVCFGLGILAVALLGCSGKRREDPILQLSAEEALAEGKRLLGKKRPEAARPYLQHAYEVEPNSPIGREALLLVADSYFLEGGDANWIQAEAKYRDFLNRFPTSDRAAYAQFQVALSLARRVERPDRDQGATEKALQAFEQVLRLYPTSEYAARAEEEIRRVRRILAEHELEVGRFYLRYGLPRAAIGRFQGLLERFPDYPEKDLVLYFLARAQAAAGEAEAAETTRKRLAEEYPNSPYLLKLQKERKP
jgi:outer membrane protein assembly factor BamD